MSLIFTDGFDSYSSSSTNALIANKWRYPEKIAGLTVASISPHNHGQSVLLNSSSDSLFMNFNLNENIPTDNMRSGIIGCHFQTSDFTLNPTEPIIALYDSTNASYQLTLRTSNVGVLQIYRGNSQFLQAGISTLLVNTWYHLEWKYYISNSIPGNTCVLRLDGATDIDLVAGTDTQFQVSSACGGLEFAGASSKNRYFDNIYICNHSGNINKDFIGPCFIETIRPDGNGTTNQFTGSDGDSTNNYLLVDEETNDDDTTFVASSVNNERDLYTFPAPTGDIGIIHGIGMVARARKNSTALGDMTQIAFISGFDFQQDQNHLHNAYRYAVDILEVNPTTNEKWADTQIPLNEFGVRYDI